MGVKKLDWRLRVFIVSAVNLGFIPDINIDADNHCNSNLGDTNSSVAPGMQMVHYIHVDKHSYTYRKGTNIFKRRENYQSMA